MKSRIARVSVHQTSKTLAFIYFLLALVILPFGLVVSLVSPVDQTVPAIFWVFFPVVYACLAYVGFAIACGIYNFVAKRAGGIEFQTENVEGSPAPSL
jgi:hypothetical protein